MENMEMKVVGVVFVDGDFDYLVEREWAEGVKELLYSEQYSGVVSLQGFKDLEFSPISEMEGGNLKVDADCVEFLHKLITDKDRGEFIGFAMLKDGVLAIKEVEPFAAVIQPKKLGSAPEREYTEYVDSTSIEDTDTIDEVSEVLFNIV